MTITGLDVVDVRFPTSSVLDGSDAMNPDPDYSAAYVTIRTDDGRRHDGIRVACSRSGAATMCRRAAIAALAPHVVGIPVPDGPGDVAELHHRLAWRLATAMARPGEGRHAHGDRRRAQRRLGPPSP